MKEGIAVIGGNKWRWASERFVQAVECGVIRKIGNGPIVRGVIDFRIELKLGGIPDQNGIDKAEGLIRTVIGNRVKADVDKLVVRGCAIGGAPLEIDVRAYQFN